jgi:hypothetical protein
MILGGVFQSLAVATPPGLGIDPVAQPGPGAMMPSRVKCAPQLPNKNKMMQREHRNDATGVLPATFVKLPARSSRDTERNPQTDSPS